MDALLVSAGRLHLRRRLVALGLGCLVILLLVAIDRVSPALAAGPPIAAYSFDEGEGSLARDSAGSHDGTVEGSSWTEAGKFGSALDFDGEEDLVRIADSADLDLTESFTLEAWVRPDTAPTFATIMGKIEWPEESEFIGYNFYAQANEEHRPNGFVANKSTYKEIYADEELPLETWTHLALTFHSEELRIYVNGNLVETAPAGPLAATNAAFTIGGSDLWGEHFDGRIDEVRVYDEALAEGEVEADMEAEVGLAPASEPLAAYSFDEGEGSLAGDSAGNHDGTVEGASWTEAGKYGSALDFDGEEDLVRIADSADLDLTESFSLEAWVRPDSSPAWATIMGKIEWPEESGFTGYNLYAQANGELRPNGFVANKSTYKQVYGPNETPLEAWTHVALTSDSEELRLYVDGKLVESAPAVPVDPTKAALTIGGNDLWGEHFEGRIDDVRLYGEALSPAEIADDMNRPVQIHAGAPRFERPIFTTNSLKVGGTLYADVSGLKGNWPMNVTYLWKRCAEYCTTLEEASDSYELQPEDAATQIRVTVTAENAIGTTRRRSMTSGYIHPSNGTDKPALAKPPMLGGLWRVDEELASTVGTWEGVGSISKTIKWERCEKELESCEVIAGATESTYPLSQEDQGMRIRSVVTATNAKGTSEAASAFTQRVLPGTYSVFSFDSGTKLGQTLKDVETSEAKLAYFSYGGSTSGVYLNRGLTTSELLAAFADSTGDNAPAERPVTSITLWGSVPTEALGKTTGESVSDRSEIPTIRRGHGSAENLVEGADQFTEEMFSTAILAAFGPIEDGGDTIDRGLVGEFTWEHTGKEVSEYQLERGRSVALEFDVKQVNRGNTDPIGEIEGEYPGICLPWEKNDFWIGTREYAGMSSNLPEGVGWYWDTAVFDSCQVKDLTFGLYHPEELENEETYEVEINFDEGGESFWEWVDPFPSLDNETPVGDADSSPFTWAAAIMGRHCDDSPWCVGIPTIDGEASVLPLVEENVPIDEAPAEIPGCYKFNNPSYGVPFGEKAGVHHCIVIS